MTHVTGLLLAAGAGRRFRRPKALVPGWVGHAVHTLYGGGCDRVVVVLGADSDAARLNVPQAASVVVNENWECGLSASLVTGLRTLSGTDAAAIHLVDLPDVGPSVVARVISGATPDALARAVYHGRPGHPVLIGSAHWSRVLTTATGDSGAHAYLSTRHVDQIECSDLADGNDIDYDPSDPRPAAG